VDHGGIEPLETRCLQGNSVTHYSAHILVCLEGIEPLANLPPYFGYSFTDCKRGQNTYSCKHYNTYNAYCKLHRLRHYRPYQLDVFYNPGFSLHKRSFITEHAHSPHVFYSAGTRSRFWNIFTLSFH
jgi:hypothetical protein